MTWVNTYIDNLEDIDQKSVQEQKVAMLLRGM